MNQDPNTRQILYKTEICRECGKFFGTHETGYMCSKCFKESGLYYKHYRLFINTEKTKTLQEKTPKIAKGLMLYSFKGYAVSRLRLEHYSTFYLKQTKEQRKNLMNPTFRKTLKYVRILRDLRKKSYDREIKNSSFYYLGSQVMKQVKAVSSLRVLFINNMSEPMFKKICKLVSKLNPNKLIINFEYVNSPFYDYKKGCYDNIFSMIKKLRNLSYLGMKNIENVIFKKGFKRNLPRYRSIIENLPRLTEISLDYVDDGKIDQRTKAFLNYEQMRKIRVCVYSNIKKESENLFQNLGNIKRLDYFQLDMNIVTRDDCCVFCHVGLFRFIGSIESVDTLVLTVHEDHTNLPLNNYLAHPSKLKNVRNIAVSGIQIKPSVRLMQLAENIDSLKIHFNQLEENNISEISEIISKKETLKELTLKFRYKPAPIIDLLEQIELENLKSFSLNFKRPLIESITSIQHSGIGPAVLEFLRKQKELEEINLQFFFPLKYQEFKTYLKRLTVLPNVKYISICLKMPKSIHILDKKFMSKIKAFCDKLKNLQYFDYRVSLEGHLTVRQKAPLVQRNVI